MSDPMLNTERDLSTRIQLASGRIYSARQKLRLAQDELDEAIKALDGMAREALDALFIDPRL